MLPGASSLAEPRPVERRERRGNPERFFRGTTELRPLGTRAGPDRDEPDQKCSDGGGGRGARDRGPRGPAARAAHGVRGVPRRGARRVQDAADSGRRGRRLPGEERGGGEAAGEAESRDLGGRDRTARGSVVSLATALGRPVGGDVPLSGGSGERSREGRGALPVPSSRQGSRAGLLCPHSQSGPRRGSLRPLTNGTGMKRRVVRVKDGNGQQSLRYQAQFQVLYFRPIQIRTLPGSNNGRCARILQETWAVCARPAGK